MYLWVMTHITRSGSLAAGVSPLVAIAVLIEGLLLALLGAAVGVAIAYTAFNGATISTLGGALWDSQRVYSLSAN
jgi:hypothetical protein